MFPKDVLQSLCSQVAALRSRCSLELFFSPYVPQGCSFPVPLSPRGVLESTCSTHVFPQSQCSQSLYAPELDPIAPVPMFLRSVFPSLCSPNLFPSPFAPQSLYSPWPFVTQSRCSPKVFPVPMFSKDIPQSRCSPVPTVTVQMFPSSDVPSLSSPCVSAVQSPKSWVAQRTTRGGWLGGPYYLQFGWSVYAIVRNDVKTLIYDFCVVCVPPSPGPVS